MRATALALLLAGLLLGLTGCLDRVETITVRKDGSLHIRHGFDASGGDLDNGAARKPDSKPWTARRRTYKNDNGDVHHVLDAEAVFASAADVPDDFGDPTGRGLRFSTKLTVMKAGEATRYRFERRYLARKWADNEFYIDHGFPEELRNVVRNGDGLDELSKDQRKELVAGLIRAEIMQKQDWAMRAAGMDVEDRLALRAEVAAYYARAVRRERVLAALDGDEDFDDLTEKIHVGLRAALARKAHDRRGETYAAKMLARFDKERHDFDVTHDLGDETFVIRLKLPGRIVAHNANRIEDGRLVWELHGKEMRDRDNVLLAVSERGGKR